MIAITCTMKRGGEVVSERTIPWDDDTVDRVVSKFMANGAEYEVEFKFDPALVCELTLEGRGERPEGES